MKSIHIIIVLMITICFGGCSSVTTEYDTTADYNNYKKYCWMEEENDGIGNEFIKYQLRSSIENKLRSIGYTITEPEKADYLIGFKIRVRKETMDLSSDSKYPETIDAHSSYGNTIWDFSSSHTPTTIPVTYLCENLYIKMYDAKTKKLLWRGYSETGCSDDMSAEKKSATLSETAKFILDNFPAK